jgi:photosystem II stability/assembly factor-like uncharacterized protein
MTMRGNIRLLKSRASLLVLLAILSCDTFKDDSIQPEKQVTFSQTEYYVLPGSSVVIDLEAIVKQSFTDATLNISQAPLRGELSHLDVLLLKYTPDSEFLEGKDEFVFSVMRDQKVIATQTMTILMKRNSDELPCGLYAIEDKVSLRSGSSVEIHVRKNDRICGIDGSSFHVSVRSNPDHGEVRLVGDTVIVYTADPTFTGSDELLYRLSGSNGEGVSYGMVTLSILSKAKIRYLKVNGSSLFFLDENIGYLAGTRIVKTTDGGEHWNVLPVSLFDTYPCVNFDDLFFLDANNGFATYSVCVEGEYARGLISTSDGGASWKKINFEYPIIDSYFFASMTTGFVGVNTYLQDSTEINKVYKTEDAGSTWREVFARSGQGYHYWGPSIQFTDSFNGYALQGEVKDWNGDFESYEKQHRDRIFMTTDGGESWKESISNKYIFSMAVIPENIICAIFSTSESSTAPSSVVRSVDGVTWKPVANFQYNSWRLGFSPAGGLGLTVGMSGPSPMVDDTLSQIISIRKSTDKGETWNEELLGEPLYGFPWRISVASDKVAYILCGGKLLKYTTE